MLSNIPSLSEIAEFILDHYCSDGYGEKSQAHAKKKNRSGVFLSNSLYILKRSIKVSIKPSSILWCGKSCITFWHKFSCTRYMVECTPINASATVLFIHDYLSSIGFRMIIYEHPMACNLPIKLWLLDNKYTCTRCIWTVTDTIEHKIQTFSTVNTCTRTWCERLNNFGNEMKV